MISLKNQRYVQDVRVKLIGHLTSEHVKKICGDIEFRLRRDWIEIIARATDRCDDRRKPRRQTRGYFNAVFAREVPRIFIEERQCRYDRAQRVHRVDTGGNTFN